MSMLRSGCFSGERRPQCTSRASAPAESSARRSRSRCSGENVARSTPSGTCVTLVAPIRSNSARANAGGAHDRVVGRCHPGVRHVGHAPGRPVGQQELREQPVQPLVRDHDARHPAPRRPRPEPAQREPVGHLDGVGPEPLQQPLHAPRVDGPVPAGRRQARRGHGDPADAGGQQLVGRPRAGHHEHDLVPASGVARPQVVQRRAEPAGAGPVEVRQLDDPHRLVTPPPMLPR